ncbi:MAG: hypothetical protein AAFR21_18945 [Pseudomonadota bacterium]
MLHFHEQSSPDPKKLHDIQIRSSDTGSMDEMDPARVLFVEAIALLEDTIEKLMPAQAPRSTEAEIKTGVRTLRQTCVSIAKFADRIESSARSRDGS